MEQTQDGFSLITELQNITKIAAGHQNAALDHDGNMYTWSQGKPITKFQGHLQDICIGAMEKGIARGYDNQLYEWGISGFTKINKRAQMVF